MVNGGQKGVHEAQLGSPLELFFPLAPQSMFPLLTGKLVIRQTDIRQIDFGKMTLGKTVKRRFLPFVNFSDILI